MSEHPPAARRTRRWWIRWALAFFPRDFRTTYAEEIQDFVSCRLTEASETPAYTLLERACRSRPALVLRLAVELAANGLAERCSRLDAARSPTDQRSRCQSAAVSSGQFCHEPNAVQPNHARLPHRRPVMIANLTLDLRHAWRSLRGQPATLAPVVAMLALGMAACTLFFSLAGAVLIDPLPFEAADELMTVRNRYGDDRTALSPPDFQDHLRASGFASLAAWTPSSVALETRDRVLQIEAARTTPGFFETLGVAAALGSPGWPTTQADDQAVVAISHDLWVTAFGSDPDVIGQTIRVDRSPFTISAVMPSSLEFPRTASIWLPLVFDADQLADQNRGNEYLEAVARLEPGVSFAQATELVENTAANVIELVPDRASYLSDNGWSAGITPLDEHEFSEARSSAWMLSSAAALLMIIACVNAGVLLMVRTSRRRSELRTRALLGAQPFRLATQLLLENTLIAGLAGVLGLGLALALAAGLGSALPSELARFQRLDLDLQALVLTLGLVLLTTFLFGALPSWAGSRSDVSSRGQMGRRGLSRLRRVLVTQEIAIAVVLLLGAGALLQEFTRLSSLELGFEVRDRTSFRVTLPSSAYPDRESRRAFADELLSDVRSWPEVRHAAAADRLPLDGRRWGGTFYPEGWTAAPGEPTPGAEFNVVTEDYFATLGIQRLEGRDLHVADTADGPPVVLIDRVAAERYWPDGAVGRRITFDREADPVQWREIVGVVEHVRREELDGLARPQVYLPNRQGGIRDLTVAVFAPGSSISAERISATLARLDPSLPAFAIEPLEQKYQTAVSLPRYRLFFVSAFAATALIYCLLGVYSVLSLTVRQRRPEIGLRVALGSSTRSVMFRVLGDGLQMTGWGLVLGTAVGYATLRSLEGLRATTSEASFWAIVASVAGICLAACALAAVVPARSAASTHPATTLRS